MNTIKVPKTIPVCSRRYAVQLCNLLDEEVYGKISHGVNAKIIIDPQANKIRQNITLWHEILHAIDVAMHTRLDEETIGRLSEGMAQVIRDGFELELDWGDIENE